MSITPTRPPVFWLYGLPGAGKTTLAHRLRGLLQIRGFVSHILDGDEIRKGLCRDLGYLPEHRAENIRRAAEVARIVADAGIIPICAFITPAVAHRETVRTILGAGGVIEIHVATSEARCRERDPKGLFARAHAGNLPHFTGVGAAFEPPGPDEPYFTVDTDNQTPEASAAELASLTFARLGA